MNYQMESVAEVESIRNREVLQMLFCPNNERCVAQMGRYM